METTARLDEMAGRRYILDARTTTAHFPGICRYVRNLAQALVPLLEADERLLLLHNQADPTAWDPTSLASPQVEIIPTSVSPFALAQQWQIPQLLRARRHQLSATRQQPLYHSPYYLMPYRPGVPTVLTVYDLIAMLHPQAVSRRARLLFRITTRLALRTSQHVIAISEATRQDLLAHFPLPRRRVTTIPLAAAPRFQPQSATAIARLRRQYALPERYLLYLGINKPHKNLVRLIEAYAKLHRSLSTAHPPPLIIAGAWDERYPQPRQRVDALNLAGAVRFLGRVSDADLPALYSGATLFVFPSQYEGFGLPVLEAMACGAPVACSDTSSLPEVAGEAALLFDPADVDAIAAAMQRPLRDENLRRVLAQHSLQQARRFSWPRTAEETLACYRSVASADR